MTWLLTKSFPAVTRAGRAVDAEDVAIYLADYEQTMLVPLPDGTDRTPLEIDATLAGRAFAAIAIQEADTGAGRRLWLPLLDGAERLGVLGLTLPRVDDALRKRCSWLATLVAEMILARNRGSACSPTGRRFPAGQDRAGDALQPRRDIEHGRLHRLQLHRPTKAA